MQFPGLAWQVLGGQGSVAPSWQPAQPPWLCGATAVSSTDQGSDCSQAWNGGARLCPCFTSQTASAPTQLLEHCAPHAEKQVFPTNLVMMCKADGKSLQLLLQNSIPPKRREVYCTTEPAEGMHLQFILVPPGNSIWFWRALGLLRPVRGVLHVWLHSQDGG